MNQILDQRNVTFESSNRAAVAFAAAKVVEDVVEAIYRVGRGETGFVVEIPAWKLTVEKLDATYVSIRIGESKLTDAVRKVLRALDFVVKTMREPDAEDDHLVVLI